MRRNTLVKIQITSGPNVQRMFSHSESLFGRKSFCEDTRRFSGPNILGSYFKFCGQNKKGIAKYCPQNIVALLLLLKNQDLQNGLIAVRFEFLTK